MIDSLQFTLPRLYVKQRKKTIGTEHVTFIKE